MFLCSFIIRGLELLDLPGKRDVWHVLIFQTKDKMQVHLYLLDAKAVSSEEVEGGTRKPLLNFCSSTPCRSEE